jgi:hypothetical protein
MKVSVLILTFNEEANLDACLDALAWCDDILVLDSGSTDRTVEIARANKARVLCRRFDNFASQRNFGLEHGSFKHEWILHLDADEIVTPEFVGALDRLSCTETLDAYRVPSKLILFGRWLRHAGMYPTYQVRLGHRERLRFSQVGHGQRETSASERIGLFPEPYLHYSFAHGMRHWLEKHVRYAQDEAELLRDIKSGRHKEMNVEQSDATQRRRSAKAMSARLPLCLRPVARFTYVYIFRRGFLDGRAGLAYAVMLAVYEGMVAAFGYESLLAERSDIGSVSYRFGNEERSKRRKSEDGREIRF